MFLGLVAGLALANTKPSEADQFARMGRELLAQIKREFYIPANHLYAENATEAGPGKVSYNWGAGVMLSALDAAAAYDEKLKPQLIDYAHAVQAYWSDAGPVPGYNSQLPVTNLDRYYDDNEWMVLALHEASLILKDPELGSKASAALKYVLSGEDDKLGGGLYWRETAKTSKNTCSNAPAIVAILYHQQPLRDTPEFKHAVQLYNWTVKNLHDPETGLFWDNIALNGNVDKHFYSYNTALMIDANAMLAQRSGNFMYGARAELLERQSVEKWVNPDGSIADEAAFAHKLIEAWLLRIQLAPAQKETIGSTKRAALALRILHDHIRDRNGHYPHRWDTPQTEPLKKWDLLSQASAARAYFLMALYLKNSQTPLGI